MQCGPALRAEFEWERSRFLRFATITAAIILMLAAAQQLLQPENIFELNTNTTSNAAMLVILLMVAGIFNFSCLSLQLMRYLSQLRNLTNKDPLTGLHNRRSFDERIAIVWQAFQESRLPVAASVLDLDHFKRINDQHGHGAGDEVLKLTAKMMKSNARDTDIIARLGGEEFVIVMPDTTLQKASAMLERLRNTLETTRIHTEHDSSINITCSMGLTALQVQDADFNSALTRADNYMYEAKSLGRNQLYTEPPSCAAGATPA